MEEEEKFESQVTENVAKVTINIFINIFKG